MSKWVQQCRGDIAASGGGGQAMVHAYGSSHVVHVA